MLLWPGVKNTITPKNTIMSNLKTITILVIVLLVSSCVDKLNKVQQYDACETSLEFTLYSPFQFSKESFVKSESNITGIDAFSEGNKIFKLSSYFNQRVPKQGIVKHNLEINGKGNDTLGIIPINKKIAIVAHRGGKHWAPENTLAAYKKCADNGLHWEADLNLTADGEIVLMHDMTLDRTTNARTVFGGSNISVNSKTLAQIKILDAGSHFSDEYAGEKVPTLDEFLDYFVENTSGNTTITMDTKLDRLHPDPKIYQSIIDKIAARDLFDRVFIEVTAIEKVHITKALRNGDKIKYAIWTKSDTTLINNSLSNGYFSRIHAFKDIAYKADDIHAGGVTFITAQTRDNQEDLNYIEEFNVDGIITDKPDVALYLTQNEIPTCSIQVLQDSSNIHVGKAIVIKANVDDSDSSVTKVEFYKNGSLIGQDTISPYSYVWEDTNRGIYSLTAKVFDNGMTKISEPVKICVE